MEDLKTEPVNAVTPVDTEKALADMPGAFVNSLRRGNKQIRSDRALAIAEDAQMIFKREIEDISTGIKRMKRDRENMLDMSPDNTLSLKLASDFDAKEFVKRDLELGIKIRNEEIKLEIATSRYTYLFGPLN